MVLSKSQARTLYRRRAPQYDRAVGLFRIVGADVREYRCRTVQALHLRHGDTVVDLGCGTGLNFPFLERAVGKTGRVLGVDLTDAMLEQARRRIAQAGWNNVELVEADISEYTVPADVAGVLSTFAITMVDDYDTVIQRAGEALRPGARLAIFEMREPKRWPECLIRLGLWLTRPFGVSRAYAKRTPWESVRRHLDRSWYEEFYAGALYLSVGERAGNSTTSRRDAQQGAAADAAELRD